jgi:hypothetical protein
MCANSRSSGELRRRPGAVELHVLREADEQALPQAELAVEAGETHDAARIGSQAGWDKGGGIRPDAQ